MDDDTFAIAYLEMINGKNYPMMTLWEGRTYQKALQSFWESFDDNDKKRISDVRIYELVLIPQGE